MICALLLTTRGNLKNALVVGAIQPTSKHAENSSVFPGVLHGMSALYYLYFIYDGMASLLKSHNCSFFGSFMIIIFL
jgi:hypothetical protein